MRGFSYYCETCKDYYESFNKTCTYQHPPTDCNHALERKLTYATGGIDGRKQKDSPYAKSKPKNKG